VSEDPTDIPTVNEALLSFAHEKVTLRCHGIEQDFLIDEMFEKRDSKDLIILIGRIRSIGSPKRIATGG
jgi:hypothetical protein